jgi:predicted RNase H-like HicB family nuclease
MVMDREKMLDLPGREIYTNSQLYKNLQHEFAVQHPVVYHITAYQSEYNEYDGKNLWIADVDEFPNIGAYEDTLEEALKMVGDAIEWMINQTTGEHSCPVCGKGQLSHHRGFWERDYKGHKLMTPYSYSRCNVCLSEIADKDQVLNEHPTKHKGWTDYGI